MVGFRVDGTDMNDDDNDPTPSMLTRVVGLKVDGTEVNDDDNDATPGLLTEDPVPWPMYVVATTFLVGKVVGCTEVVFFT